MSNEYNMVTTVTSPEPSETHEEMGNQLMRDAFGLNPNVAEAKATLMVKDNEGNASFTIIDFNRSRDLQVQMSTRTINESIYGQLSSSFDKMAAQFNTPKIDDAK